MAGKIKSLRWWIIGLVTMGTVLNYLARSTLSVAAPTLKAELGITTQQYSWIVIAFQASYTVMQTVAGAVLDALGTRLGFMIFAVGWAIANALHALAGGWAGLAFFRALLGANEAAAPPGPRSCPNGSRARTFAGHQRFSDGNQHRQHDRAAAGGLLHPVVGVAFGLCRVGRAQSGLVAGVVGVLSPPR
jgi:MFS family permease